MIGFPYGSTGDLVGKATWVAVGGATSPVMSVGPDTTTDWIQASPNPGTNIDQAARTFIPVPIVQDFTVTFHHYYTPTTGLQRTQVWLEDTLGGNVTIGVDFKYTGTGAGSVTTAMLFDNAADTGYLTAVFLPGTDNEFKITYDGTYIRLFVNGAPQITWPHVIAIGANLSTVAHVYLRWVTGFGGDMFMKDLELQAGVL